MNLRFEGRGRLLPGVRHLIVEVCSEYLGSEDVTQQLVTATQELLENLVKYSEPEASVLEFELRTIDGQPTARIHTQNRASEGHLREAQRVLAGIVSAPDPVALYQAMVSSSGDREGSGLGLARLRAEVGFNLSYAVQRGWLSIEARRSVEPRRAESMGAERREAP